MPSAVEEILRWTTATLYNRRTATRDTELHGHLIRQGEKVTLWWPSANRDESVFDDPFRFDIRGIRIRTSPLATGPTSALEPTWPGWRSGSFSRRYLDRLENFELTGPVKRVRTNKHAGVSSVPLRFSKRSAK